MITTQEFSAMTNPQAQKALDAMSVGELVQFYNTLAVASVKKFSDKATGIKRIWKVREELGMTSKGNQTKARDHVQLSNGATVYAPQVTQEQHDVNVVNEPLKAMLMAHDFRRTQELETDTEKKVLYMRRHEEATFTAVVDEREGGVAISDGTNAHKTQTTDGIVAILTSFGLIEDEPVVEGTPTEFPGSEPLLPAKGEPVQGEQNLVAEGHHLYTQGLADAADKVRDSKPEPEDKLARPVAQNLLELVAKHGIELGGQPMTNPKTTMKVRFSIPNQGNGGQDLLLTFFFNDAGKASEFGTFASSTDGVKDVEVVPVEKPTPTPVDRALKAVKTDQAKKLPPKPTRKEDDAATVVRLLTNLNPKKAGTASFDRFENYVDGMTVADALAAGITRADLRWDSDHKHIKLEPKS